MVKLIFLPFLILLILCGYLIFQNSRLSSNNTALESRVAKLETATSQPANNYNQGTLDLKSNCPKSAVIPDSEFLADYTVKPGDTLLSISKTQLGSTSRVNELIEINKKNYPQLTVQTPFLEKDWILQIPSGEFKDQKFPIHGVNGEIVGSTSDSLFWVKTKTGVSGGFNLLDDTIIEPAGTKFKVGDCVSYYAQSNGELGSFFVRLQPTN